MTGPTEPTDQPSAAPDSADPAATPSTASAPSLGAFRDLRRDERGAPLDGGVALRARRATVMAVALAGAALLLGVGLAIAVSLRQVRYGAPIVVTVGLWLVIALAVGAIVAAIVSLVLHFRSGTGGMLRAAGSAIVAVISAGVLIFAIGNPPPAERGGAGRGVLRPGTIPLVVLAVGDCLVAVPPAEFDDPNAAVVGVPCTEDHAARVVAVTSVPDDGTSHLAACEDAVATQSPEATGEIRTVAPTPELKETYDVGVLVCVEI